MSLAGSMQGELAEAIVDQAYEAAVIPELWPRVLERIAGHIDAAGGILFVASEAEIRWTASGGSLDLMHAFLSGGWDKRNTRATRLAAMNYPGFIHDLDAFTREEIDRDPFYTELCRPLGLGWSTGTQMKVPNGDMMVYSLDRRFELGPFERIHVEFLDSLRPHLARAGLLSARLQLQRAQTTAETLAILGLPAAVLRSDARVIAANSLLEQLTNHVCFGAFDRLHLRDRQADQVFVQELRQLDDSPGSGVLSIALPTPADQMAVLHLLPVRRAAHDVFAGAKAICIVTPVSNAQPPSEALLNGLFDLTPAEARVARGLGSGETIQSIARCAGLSTETVRCQVKSVLAKTGTHRQAELTRLLTSVAGASRWPIRT